MSSHNSLAATVRAALVLSWMALTVLSPGLAQASTVATSSSVHAASQIAHIVKPANERWG